MYYSDYDTYYDRKFNIKNETYNTRKRYSHNKKKTIVY